MGKLFGHYLINTKILKAVVFMLIMIFWGSFLVYKITLPAAQDLPRQMKNGEMVLQGQFNVTSKNIYSYTEPEHQFANHHWLYGVMVYILHEMVGWNGMVIFKVILFLVMFSLLFYLSAKRSSFWIAAVFSIPTIFLLISRTALRPEMISYFFVVIYLYLLINFNEKPESKLVWLLVPLQLIWVNTHLFFVIGIILAGCFLLQSIVIDYKKLKNSLRVKKFLLLVLLMSLVVFINPFGLPGAVYSLKVNSDPTFPVGPGEVDSIPSILSRELGWNTLSAQLYIPVFIILMVSFALAIIYRIKNKSLWYKDNLIFYLMTSIFLGALGYKVMRGVPLFGLIFLPAVCTNLKEIYTATTIKIKDKGLYTMLRLGVPLGLTCILILLIVWSQKIYMAATEQGLGLAAWSENSARFLVDNDIAGPVFNDADIGSYLIYYLYPREKVFTDNRFGDAYSREFFGDTYLPLIQNDEKWEEGLEKYNFNVIFFYHYDNVDGARDFIYRRIYDPKWAWVYADPYAVILLRNNEENKDLIDKYQIKSENLTQKLSYLTDSKNPEDQLSGADILNLVGRFDLSLPVYMKVVSSRPDMGKVWLVLGRTELMKSDQENSDPYLGALYLERAIAEGWKTWEAYSFLALAYYRTDQIDRAKKAVDMELKIDPRSEDGLKWLEILDNAEKEQNKAN